MTKEEARGKAAQAWCKSATSSKVMDVTLCEEFAKILYTEVNDVLWDEVIKKSNECQSIIFKTKNKVRILSERKDDALGLINGIAAVENIIAEHPELVNGNADLAISILSYIRKTIVSEVVNPRNFLSELLVETKNEKMP